MYLVNVEYTFDVGKIIFYFTADGRIDFRELVKDLAAVFRTRIELRQIGVGTKPRCWAALAAAGVPCAVLPSWGILNRYPLKWPRNRTCP